MWRLGRACRPLALVDVSAGAHPALHDEGPDTVAVEAAHRVVADGAAGLAAVVAPLGALVNVPAALGRPVLRVPADAGAGERPDGVAAGGVLAAEGGAVLPPGMATFQQAGRGRTLVNILASGR